MIELLHDRTPERVNQTYMHAAGSSTLMLTSPSKGSPSQAPSPPILLTSPLCRERRNCACH